MHAIRLRELFKVGIGPSSSHTTGPMLAARHFVRNLSPETGRVHRITVTLYGSLAMTGSGHGTPGAVMLGLHGHRPDQLDPSIVPAFVAGVQLTKRITLDRQHAIGFDPAQDIVIDVFTEVEEHPNALRFCAFDVDQKPLVNELWFSVGGGFVERQGDPPLDDLLPLPHLFTTGNELLAECAVSNLTVHELVLANECSSDPASGTESAHTNVVASIDQLVNVMMECVDLGLLTDGVLPGSLGVQRRAKALFESARVSEPHVGDRLMQLATYAMAVNEQNAAGQRVVTAPTNGAAGVIPAVLRHLRDERPEEFQDASRIFMLTATAIGAIIKHNASISGAEVGCQGEVGSASAMAAAGLCAAYGGTPEQIEHAAEIALEHHLGMTCDPVGGLVQIPCIERNGFGATKAVLAAHLSLRGGGEHLVSLDQVVHTMRETGRDMHTNYRETSRGGLAVNVPNC